MGEGSAGRIFISYRRADTPHVAGRLFDRLATRFGAGHVFMDVDSIEPGLDFAETIEAAVGACDVLLVLIGPNWVEAVDEQGRRRLEDPDDFVALEITAALRRRIRVIPVLVDGAPSPRRGTCRRRWRHWPAARVSDWTTPRSAPAWPRW